MVKNFKLRPFILGIFFALSSSFINYANAITVKSDEISSLEKGNVVQKSLSSQLNNGLRGAESKILIDASPQKVWGVIDKKENLPKFIRQVKKAKVIEEAGSQQKVAATVKLCDLLPSFSYILAFDRSEKYKKMKFKKLSGAFKELYGYFEIIPYENKTILAYRIYSDPGFYIPEFINKSMRGDAVSIMKSIKAEAEK